MIKPLFFCPWPLQGDFLSGAILRAWLSFPLEIRYSLVDMNSTRCEFSIIFSGRWDMAVIEGAVPLGWGPNTTPDVANCIRVLKNIKLAVIPGRRQAPGWMPRLRRVDFFVSFTILK